MLPLTGTPFFTNQVRDESSYVRVTGVHLVIGVRSMVLEKRPQRKWFLQVKEVYDFR